MQEVRFARWRVRRQLCFSVKWLRIFMSVGNIFRMNALPPHSRSMRGKCHSFTFPVHCSNWPVQGFGYFHLQSIFLAIWQSHVFTLRTFILQMKARIFSEPLFRVALVWATCWYVVDWNDTRLTLTLRIASPLDQVFSRTSVSTLRYGARVPVNSQLK
jgi:hypothetical protein